MHSSNLSPRQSSLDNLRSLVIFLVVVMHSNVTYSGMGGWYYKEGAPDRLDLFSKIFFGLYGSFTQAWFMGILFFLAAFFAARSLERRGTCSFVQDRLFRLGLPLLVYSFIIHPLMVYFLYDGGRFFRSQGLGEFFWAYLAGGHFWEGTGPLWFVEALLGFCLVYALVRHFFPRKNPSHPVHPTHPPLIWTFLGLIVGVGAAAFLLRQVWPIGSSVANLQFGFFASYIALFLLGLHQGERGWRLTPSQACRWLYAALGLGLPLWGLLMVTGGALTGTIPLDGGVHWQALVYAFWEAFVALAMTLGLPFIFDRYLNADIPITRLLAAQNFRIFMFHAPVLLGLSLILGPWQAPLLAKHLAVAPLAYLVTLGLAILLGKVPGLKQITK